MTGRNFQQFSLKKFSRQESNTFKGKNPLPLEPNYFLKSCSYDSKTSNLFGKKSNLMDSEIMDLLTLKNKNKKNVTFF